LSEQGLPPHPNADALATTKQVLP
jgi:hypothetical protein